MPTRKISRETRMKWARVGFGIFQGTFTYYRLSRKLLSLPLDFIHLKLAITMARIRRTIQVISATSSSRWYDELPQEIMQLILQRLHRADYLRCGAVCHSWRAAVNASKFKCIPQLPWLMLRSHPFSLKNHCLFSLSDQKAYKSSSFSYNNDYISRRDCVGSIEGWLIMADSDFWRPEGFMYPWSFCLKAWHDYLNKYATSTVVNFFLNPISGARVMLPSQSTIPYLYSSRHFFFEKVVASSIPITTSLGNHYHLTNSSCLVVGLCAGGGFLAFCRPSDKSWTLIDPGIEARHLIVRDIEITDGKLYAATLEASQFLMVFDISQLHAKHDHADGASPANRICMVPPQRLVMLHPGPVPSVSYQTTGGVMYFTDNYDTYLAADPTLKELFMIFHKISFSYEEHPIIPWSILGGNYVIPPQTQGFQVFKLEGNVNGHRWVEVEDLGDQILFVSKASNKVISASSLRGANYKKEIEGNCIYFAFDNPCLASPWTGRNFGMFSLTNKSIKRFIVPNDHHRTSLFHTQTIWFNYCVALLICKSA